MVLSAVNSVCGVSPSVCVCVCVFELVWHPVQRDEVVKKSLGSH